MEHRECSVECARCGAAQIAFLCRSLHRWLGLVSDRCRSGLQRLAHCRVHGDQYVTPAGAEYEAENLSD